MVGSPLSGLAFLPTILFCWICSRIRKIRGEEYRINGLTPFDVWSIDNGSYPSIEVPMHVWERIGLIAVMTLNVFGPIAFVIWYVNVNHIPLVREDINDPKVIQQGIIWCSAIILLFSVFFVWILGGFDKLMEIGEMTMKRFFCWLGKHRWSYCYGSNQAYCEYCGKAKLKDKDVRSTMIRG